MKYIYYILAIVICFSGLAAYGLFDARLDVSEPVLSINDRIYSASELEKLLKAGHSDMTRDQFIESLIEKQLLIQEALKQEINKEENFRLSVQNFYEQSLIKILLDRKYDAIIVDVTTDEVARYEELTTKKLVVTKLIYPTMQDFQDKTNKKIQHIETAFINLSDELKFIALGLKKGVASKEMDRGSQGVIIYQLDDILPLEESALEKVRPFDVKRVSLFIQDKKKEQVLKQWIAGIRKSADIWRK